MADLGTLRRALLPVEQAAAHLPWADERAWTVHSHVWLEEDLPVIDLHDLGVRQARQAVTVLADRARDLDLTAVCFVVGRGRHSVGRKRLQPAVQGELRRITREQGGSFSPQGEGRLILVLDGSRAPRRATGGLSPLMWAGIAVFSLLLAAILPPVGLPLCLALLTLGIRTVLRRRRR